VIYSGFIAFMRGRLLKSVVLLSLMFICELAEQK